MDDPIRQEDISFNQLQSQRPNNYSYPQLQTSLYDLRTFDASSPLIVKTTHDPFPRGRTTVGGVPGGVEDMLAVVEACLQVNTLDRAALVLERLGALPGALPEDELIALHNRYLRARLDLAFEQSNDSWAQSLHKFFELEIRARDLPHTSETIACMLKASILSARGSTLQRLVDRYMGMVPGDAMFDVLAEDDILTQQDLGIITSIYQPASSMNFDDPEMFQNTDSGLLNAESTSPASEVSESKADFVDSDDVRPVEQKGLGLKTLRGVLSFFKDIQGEDLSRLSVGERREIQARLEKDCVEGAIGRWREENQALRKMGQNTALSCNVLNSQLYDWHCALEEKLKLEFAMFEESETASNKNEDDFDRCMYAPFLRQSNPTRLAAVTILSVLSTISRQGADKGIVLSLLLNNLAKSVEEDIKQQIRENENPYRKGKGAKGRKRMSEAKKQQADAAPALPKNENETASNVAEVLTSSEANKQQPDATQALPESEAASNIAEVSVSSEANTQQPDASQALPESEPASNIIEVSAYDTRSWPIYIRAKVGAVLLGALLDSAKVNVVREHPETKALISQIQPAMTHSIMHRRGRKVGVVLANKWLVDLMMREPRGEFLARHLPMLVEPEPWTRFDKGGFLNSPAHLVRTKGGEKDQRIYAEAALERGDMEQVSKGLDVLGRTAWQVNQNVFKVMLEAWNSGEKLANIPPLHPNIPTPPEPAPSDDMMHRREWLKAVKAAENLKSGLHSERCFINFQLEIARAFKDQTFYFPHNMDFRGRAYPIPPYLNHMGADHARGLLRFAVGRELGESGLRWLKVHLANVFGYDKASLKERESFAMDNLANIHDSADNPLNGQRWWLKAEDPWQCLATCFELKAALESPEPTKYVSHIPVQMDGTCNGLQHYAALGGDLWGAQQVNLVPGDRPADVYSAVANLVKENIAEDVKADNFLAKAIDGKITRKVVKQTVMTNVYGVTFVGAKAQVLKQLDAAYPNLQEETGVPTSLVASYVATKIFKALSTMFRGAHDIQYWLGECAGRVCRALTPEQLDLLADGTPTPKPIKRRAPVKSKSKLAIDEILSSFRSTIVWTTPLRMPVVQPYRKTITRVVETSLQNLNLQIPERSDPVNRRKQLQGFPPNFIHSLDASHMLLSALECDELGLSFAAVHDSFWTHAADIDTMNRVLRDAFVRIHCEDVIGRLGAEFEARYKGSLFLSNIELGSPLEAQVKEYRKQNKLTMRDEILQERERQRLLRSEDPEEVERGRAMVTPASLFEAHSRAQIETASDEISEVALGHIPNDEDSSRHRLTNNNPNDDDHALAVGEDSGETADLAATAPAPATDEFEVYRPCEDEDHVKSLMQYTQFEMKLKGATAEQARRYTPAQKKKNKTPVQVWLPLVFPEIPKKVSEREEEEEKSFFFFKKKNFWRL